MTNRSLLKSAFLPLVVGGLVAMMSAVGGCGAKNGDGGLEGGGLGSGLSGDDGSSGGDDAGGGGQGTNLGDGGSFTVSVADSGAAASKCTTGGELDCYVANCATGGTAATTLSGTVYDPAGKNPIYNAVVYVPDSATGTLPAITTGTSSCSSCDASIGNYIAATTTDYMGHFTLKGVPATTHVPLVVQIGKWRREVFISSVNKCTNNVVPAGDSRLPTTITDGSGPAGSTSMPRMALLTGGADNLGCFLSGLGIASTEWGSPHGGGHLDVYQGSGGAGVTNGTAGNCAGGTCGLWNTMADLQYYDIVLLACEGETYDNYKGAPAMENMHTWLDQGGKMFGTHFHYTWFKDGPNEGCTDCNDFVATGNPWRGVSSGSASGNYDIDTTFFGGSQMSKWLSNLGLLNTDGTIALNQVADSVGLVGTGAQRWIYDPASPNDTKYMSIETPIGGIKDAGAPAKDSGTTTESTGPQYCGKAVFSDLHAGGSAAGGSIISIITGGGGTVPGSCPTNATLSAQEAALEFLFFDLSACVTAESAPTPIPPPNQPQ